MDIYRDLDGVRLGADGQVYHCAVGIANLEPETGRIALKLIRQGTTSGLVVPAGAWITQMALAIPRPILLGYPQAEIKLAPRSNSDPDRVPLVLASADDSGLLVPGRYGCPFLDPGSPYRAPMEQQEYGLFGLAKNRAGDPAEIRAADGGALAIAAAIWYSSPVLTFAMDEWAYRSRDQSYTPS